MNWLRLPSLTLFVLLLTGCFGVRSNYGLTTVELEGELGLVGELWLTQDSNSLLVHLCRDREIVLSLNPGLWQMQALSRDAQGHVISLSEPIKVQGSREVVVALVLSTTEKRTTEVRATNVVHSLALSGGAELYWESYPSAETLEKGNWEVWKRHQDSAFWQKTKTLPPGEGSFADADSKAHEYLYALRFVAPEGDEPVFPSPLRESRGAEVGVLNVNWHFDHDFAPAGAMFHTSAFELANGYDPDPAFTDLVAYFRTERDFVQRAKLLATVGLTMKREIPSLQAALVEPHPDSAWSLEEWSTYQDDTLFLEPNWIIKAEAIANAASIFPWYLEYLRISGAHEETTGNHSVRIAVVDSGLDERQLPKGVTILPGYNFVAKNSDTQDDYARGAYHGTMVSRTISQVMPTLSLQPIKVLGSNGSGSIVDVSEGLLYAAGLHDSLVNPTPAQIINLSLGMSKEPSAIRNVVERIARETDILMIAAAGNTPGGVREPGLFYPAALPEVLAVGAVIPGATGPERADYSHYGHNLDVVAPESFFTGTSASTALVSGVAGLMLSQGISIVDIRSILTRTAMDIGLPGWDEEHGFGLVHAEWAVKDIRSVILMITDARGGWRLDELPLKGDVKRFYLPPGEYMVEAWVNVQGDQRPQTGDYYTCAERIVVEEEQEVDLTLTLSEKKD